MSSYKKGYVKIVVGDSANNQFKNQRLRGVKMSAHENSQNIDHSVNTSSNIEHFKKETNIDSSKFLKKDGEVPQPSLSAVVNSNTVQKAQIGNMGSNVNQVETMRAQSKM